MQYLKNTLFILFITLCTAGTAFGQKADKMQQKAMEKVEELNQQIVAGDADAALTTEQTEEIAAVYAEMMRDIKAVKKAGGTAEEQKSQKKAIRKAANQRVNKEILTKAQRIAKKEGKE